MRPSTPILACLSFFLCAHSFGDAPLLLRRCYRADACVRAENGMRFRLYPGDERAEAEVPGRHAFGSPLAVKFSLRLPSGTSLSNAHQSIVLAQLKATNGHSPTLALRLKEHDELVLTIRYRTADAANLQGEEVRVNLGTLERDQWQDFRLEALTGEHGHIEVFRNAIFRARYEGPVGYLNLPSYFKFGIYDFTRGLREPFEVEFRDWSVDPAGPGAELKR